MAMNGVITATVENIDDPQRLGRVQVRYHGPGRQSSPWARVVIPAGASALTSGHGLVAGDEVLIALDSGDRSSPYVLGKLTPDAEAPPDAPIEIVDASGHNSVVIDPVTNTVTITGSQTVIVRGTRVRIEANEIDMRAATRLSLDAPVIEIDATASLKAMSSGAVTIRGSIVTIN
jgi:hypothetical protein